MGCLSLEESLQVLDRGEKIELLVDKTENLRSQVCEQRSLLFLIFKLSLNWLSYWMCTLQGMHIICFLELLRMCFDAGEIFDFLNPAREILLTR